MAVWHHRLDAHEFGWTLGLGDGHESPTAIHGVTKSQTWLSDWTELNWNEWIYEHLSTFLWRSQCVRVQVSVSVLELTERMRPLDDRWTGLRQWEAPRYLPCPWNADVAHSSHTRSHVKNAALREYCCLYDLDWIHDWTSLRLLYERKTGFNIYSVLT